MMNFVFWPGTILVICVLICHRLQFNWFRCHTTSGSMNYLSVFTENFMSKS